MIDAAGELSTDTSEGDAVRLLFLLGVLVGVMV
jgi:hypothetical protein